MKTKLGTFLLFACAISFSACESPKGENSSLNPNKTEHGQNAARNSVNNANISAGENSNGKTNTQTTPDEKTDFEGTAGITDKKNEIKSVAVLKEVRAAQHAGYDRVVFEFEGAELPGYHLEYIDKPVRQCGSGNAVSLKGDAWLEIRFTPAAAHTEDGEPTVKNREQSPNLKIIREMKSTCDFEADVTWVLGAASPNKYRVLELKNPTRLAVDIKH
jgi:hypothetical protein